MSQQVKDQQITKSGFVWESFDVGSRDVLIGGKEKQTEMLDKIDSLGLKGQKQLVKNQQGNIIPFPRMNATEQRVWELYCPQKALLEDFADQVIPHEILSLLAVVKEKGYFDVKFANATKKRESRIEVWSEAREDIDPLIVGVIEDDEKDSEGDFGYRKQQGYYLIARWGLSLRPFEEIVKMAREKYKTTRINKLRARIEESESDIRTVDRDVDKFFGGEFVSEIY